MTVGKDRVASSCISGLMEMFDQDLDGDCNSCHEILHDCVLFSYIKFARCVCIYFVYYQTSCIL